MTASIDPKDLLLPFDLVEELENNLESYEAPDDCVWLSIPTFPGYLLTAVDSCRAHCFSVKSPGQSATIVCCIDHGIKRFYFDEDIEALINLRTGLHQTASSATDSDALEMAAQFFRRFPLGIPGTMSESQRVNVPMHPSIKRQVAGRASELGIKIGPMAVLAVMETISSQTAVHPDHAALAGDTIQKFLRGVRLRRRVAEALLKEIE